MPYKDPEKRKEASVASAKRMKSDMTIEILQRLISYMRGEI